MSSQYPQNIIIEACIETLDHALASDSKGVHQLEVCSHLELDGLSPSRELILQILNQCKATPKVMIRPRQGNFVYSEQEIGVMIEEIRWCRENDVPEIVLGALTDKNRIDDQAMKCLSIAAKGMDITFHKAIDEINDPLEALNELKLFPNVKYVLTSGQQATAWEGQDLLKEMITTGGPEINIIVAGKVRSENIHKGTSNNS